MHRQICVFLLTLRGLRLWWVAGSGAVMLLYLWNKRSKDVKTAATHRIQEPRGANQEYLQNAEGNEN